MNVSATQASASNSDLAKYRYGAWISVAAFILLGATFGITVSKFNAAADVTAVVAPVTTLIGTIIGAYFGVQAGASGKATAETKRDEAESAKNNALAILTPDQARELGYPFEH